MEKSSIAEALKALASDSQNRSKIGRMRELLGDIEAAQKAGVANSKIVETLNLQGLDISLKSFETMLYRLRKEQGKTRKSTQEVKIEKNAVPETATKSESGSVEHAASETTKSVESQGVKISEKPKTFVHNPSPDKDILS